MHHRRRGGSRNDADRLRKRYRPRFQSCASIFATAKRAIISIHCYPHYGLVTRTFRSFLSQEFQRSWRIGIREETRESDVRGISVLTIGRRQSATSVGAKQRIGIRVSIHVA